ncbi:hypothetical protein D9758_015884 [Tetrapyrgos nigripes]|uniref:Uncharacterized protein n=1 Tax=Tetrapyrgos nigripes TaxID=182062 RepID=A0A8H5CNG5_9AGAR|nr:hypothetical protein D9758_015884 [Tetrapyrgos nigripes]
MGLFSTSYVWAIVTRMFSGRLTEDSSASVEVLFDSLTSSELEALMQDIPVRTQGRLHVNYVIKCSDFEGRSASLISILSRFATQRWLTISSLNDIELVEVLLALNPSVDSSSFSVFGRGEIVDAILRLFFGSSISIKVHLDNNQKFDRRMETRRQNRIDWATQFFSKFDEDKDHWPQAIPIPSDKGFLAYLCKECLSHLSKGKLPPLSIANVFRGELPTDLLDLQPPITWAEEMACALYLMNVHVEEPTIFKPNSDKLHPNFYDHFFKPGAKFVVQFCTHYFKYPKDTGLAVIERLLLLPTRHEDMHSFYDNLFSNLNPPSPLKQPLSPSPNPPSSPYHSSATLSGSEPADLTAKSNADADNITVRPSTPILAFKPAVIRKKNKTSSA